MRKQINICPFPFLSAVYGKPILPTSSTSPSPVPFLQGGGAGGVKAGGEDATDKEGGKGGAESSDGQIIPPPSVDNIPRPLSPTKLTPVGRYPKRNQTQPVCCHKSVESGPSEILNSNIFLHDEYVSFAKFTCNNILRKYQCKYVIIFNLGSRRN